MHIVIIGWIYVVFMMSITEESIVAGVVTFIFYGLLPVGIIAYIGGSKQRRIKREFEARMRQRERENASGGLPDPALSVEREQASPGMPVPPDQAEKRPEN